MANTDDIFASLQSQFEDRKQAGDYDDALNDKMSNDVVPVWKSNSPAYPEYIESVGVTRPAQAGEGQVGATVDWANIVEYGSEFVAEHAPRSKTEAHFNRGGGQ